LQGKYQSNISPLPEILEPLAFVITPKQLSFVIWNKKLASLLGRFHPPVKSGLVDPLNCPTAGCLKFEKS
jgi:hypothetical protein